MVAIWLSVSLSVEGCGDGACFEEKWFLGHDIIS
jgi:hypothetical protein